MREESTHPSYGVLQVTRTSGGRRTLFGTSLMDHRSTIRLRLFAGVKSHGLGQDSVFSTGNPIVELEMSALQFTDLITSLNLGDGIPCTIRTRDDKQVEDPPEDLSERERIRSGFQQDADKLAADLDTLAREASQVLSKPASAKERKELVEKMGRTLQELQSNLPFLVSQFEKATDRFTAAAKAEVEAYMTNTMLHAGIRSLGALEHPVSLSDGSDSK